jgi:trk system potassium uptake protein TrkH
MSKKKTHVPFFVVLMGIGSAAMIVPSAFGLSLGDYTTMRVFFYGFLLFGTLTFVMVLATAGYQPKNVARSQLLTLLAAFTVLPLMFAIPFYEAVETTTLLNAWFEMVSSFTTTGATLYDNADRLTPALHLWRSIVGWLGGLLVWIAAISIFAPMNLGGFEVRATSLAGRGSTSGAAQETRVMDASERMTRFALRLTPIYVVLTVALWAGLTLLGEYSYVALCHAMAVLSTSGITPIGGFYYAASGFWGELLVFCFFIIAISRLVYSSGLSGENEGSWYRDPEFKIGVSLIILATIFLFLRHFVAVLDDSTQTEFGTSFQALWGALFTVASFLTTTGFESADWVETTNWTGLPTPGLLLAGLALIGGGVATTAGGIKLLRVYALYRHSERELERLVHPSSIGGGGREARRIRRKGAYISWIFFMLFAVSIAVVMVMLSLTGVQFETAMVLAVSALSTTGPLAIVAAETPIAYSGIPDLAKVILAMAMVLGRLETLAIIALFNPEIWRT